MSVHTENLKTLDELLAAFANGLEPDLRYADQRTAFGIYRKLRFGNPKTSLSSDSSQKIARVLKQYPELKEQERFRNYELLQQKQSYPITETLANFLTTQSKSAGQVRSNLLQVDANQGYWKKLLGYERPEEFKTPPGDKIARKEWQKRAKEHAASFLEEQFPLKLRDLVGDKGQPIKERSKKLFEFMVSQRERMEGEGGEVRGISQGIADLIHTVGYHDALLQKQLKSTDGMERLGAFRGILNQRDSFAMELGFEGHYAQVLEDFGVSFPTGLTEEKRLAKFLQSLEDDLLEGAEVTGDNSKRVVRHLSLMESPFRSCLGGSDCASQNYLTRALDPNYHYFTLTDEEGFSSGHMTIVQGTAKNKGEETRVAFVDKVQNVYNSDIAPMLEGIRKSVEEKGYHLALPKKMGDHNGISNEGVTREFIAKNIATGEGFKSFAPHPHSFDLDSAYSRSEDNLALFEVLPLSSKDIELKAGEVATPWRLKDLDLQELARGAVALKEGSTEDKIRYIESMKIIDKIDELEGDARFAKTLEEWLNDPSQDLRLRRYVFLFEWRKNDKALFPLLRIFQPEERVGIVQHLWGHAPVQEEAG